LAYNQPQEVTTEDTYSELALLRGETFYQAIALLTGDADKRYAAIFQVNVGMKRLLFALELLLQSLELTVLRESYLSV
jgi:hypothetical protein